MAEAKGKKQVKAWVVVVNDKLPRGFRSRQAAVDYQDCERICGEDVRGPYRGFLSWTEPRRPRRKRT